MFRPAEVRASLVVLANLLLMDQPSSGGPKKLSMGVHTSCINLKFCSIDSYLALLSIYFTGFSIF